jgi:hypothetical protein
MHFSLPCIGKQTPARPLDAHTALDGQGTRTGNANGTVQAKAKHVERVDPTSEQGQNPRLVFRSTSNDPHTQADRRYSFGEDGELQRICIYLS